MDDVNAAWIVRETDIRAENDSNQGSAVLRCEVALARDTVLVHSPVYGKDDEMCLEECYRNALNLAEEHGVADIAFPALSAGKKCFPKKKAAETAVAAIRNWLLAHRETTMRIWLVPEDARVLELMLESMNAAGAADSGFCGDLAGFVHVDAAEGLTS
jgi:O-acetyl-ADP-ribose deacetylase (regulator of RNase III)